MSICSTTCILYIRIPYSTCLHPPVTIVRPSVTPRAVQRRNWVNPQTRYSFLRIVTEIVTNPPTSVLRTLVGGFCIAGCRGRERLQRVPVTLQLRCEAFHGISKYPSIVTPTPSSLTPPSHRLHPPTHRRIPIQPIQPFQHTSQYGRSSKPSSM